MMNKHYLRWWINITRRWWILNITCRLAMGLNLSVNFLCCSDKTICVLNIIKPPVGHGRFWVRSVIYGTEWCGMYANCVLCTQKIIIDRRLVLLVDFWNYILRLYVIHHVIWLWHCFDFFLPNKTVYSC